MADGRIVNGQCVDAAAAVDLYYSSQAPSVSAGSPSYITQLEKSASGWDAVTYSGGAVVNVSALTAPGFVTCDPAAPFFDGLTLGWGVVAAMAFAWAITVLRRGIL